MVCHTPGCGRDALDVSGVLYCAPCRLAYLLGYQEGSEIRGSTVENDPHLCAACGHFDHEGTPCGWHSGTCDDAVADPTLWCRCDGDHPLGRDVEARAKCWTRVSEANLAR
jgi:hypothetical protein